MNHRKNQWNHRLNRYKKNATLGEATARLKQKKTTPIGAVRLESQAEQPSKDTSHRAELSIKTVFQHQTATAEASPGVAPVATGLQHTLRQIYCAPWQTDWYYQ